MGIDQDALHFHRSGKRPGKISLKPTKQLLTQMDLSLAYSPGVAAPCQEIVRDPETIYEYTSKGNYVAIITNGTAVLGLGNIGVAASKPVMEGKAVLFKKFADIDAIDIEIDSTDVEEFVQIVKKISVAWGGINLEDIKSPECFSIEKKLKNILDIPVFHDDQHGTAITVVAGLINALEITNKQFDEIKIVINGPGAAGIACGELIKAMGVKSKNIVYCDSKGVLYKGRKENMNYLKEKLTLNTKARTLADAIIGADVFLGLSTKDVLLPEMLKTMAKQPIVFAMANPDPEIKPELAISTCPDAIIATGRSDYPNQINNVMCFPYIFRGTLDVRAKEINQEMKIAAAKAIAGIAKETVPEEVIRAYPNIEMQYGTNYIIPSPFDPRLLPTVATAVAIAAIETGVARKPVDIEKYKEKLMHSTDAALTTLNTLYAMAKSKRKKVIFAEGEEYSVIRAASQLYENGYIQPILVGDCAKIAKAMKNLGIKNKNGIKTINAAISPHNDLYIDYAYNKLKRHGFLLRDCARAVKNKRNVFASCMLACGHGDAMLAGLTRNYHKALNEICSVLANPDDSKEILFGMTVNAFADKTIFITDTNVIKNPTAVQMASMAILTAKEVENLGFIPRVAFIDSSNFGSHKSENYDKIQLANKILQQHDVTFEHDGELSISIALNYDKIKNRYQFCRLTAAANILIMPNMLTANSVHATIKEMAGAKVIGPMLVGTLHSVQILEMDSKMNDIINAAIWATAHMDDINDVDSKQPENR
ncbi:phosphate acyltransferase [Candidatus Xenohaliotis californiensis]